MVVLQFIAVLKITWSLTNNQKLTAKEKYIDPALMPGSILIRDLIQEKNRN